MNIEYEWSKEIEAAARAIAAVDGGDLDENAFPMVAVPTGFAAAYWCRAVTAVCAYIAAVPELNQSIKQPQNTMDIEPERSRTHHEVLEDIVNRIYQMHSGKGASKEPLSYFLNSQHPIEIDCLKAAEDIFEVFTGDSPDYDEE